MKEADESSDSSASSQVGRTYPIEPSICNSMSLFSSTAYSNGISLVIGSAKAAGYMGIAFLSSMPTTICCIAVIAVRVRLLTTPRISAKVAAHCTLVPFPGSRTHVGGCWII